MSTAWVRHQGFWQASADRVIYDSADAGAPGEPMEVGARLPLTYDAASLPDIKWYVSPSGNDTTGNGTSGLPFKTLGKAVTAVNGPGQAIILAAGTYPFDGTSISVTAAKKGLLIIAASGADVVFDGSIAAPTSTTVEGLLRFFPYTQMPANFNAESVNLTSGAFPVATFDASGNPTGLAGERGFANIVNATTYNIPATQTLVAASNPKVVVGGYPDQVWKNGVQLKQVFVKAKVAPGFFWVDRANANDGDTARSTSLYLHQDDAVDMTKIRVSGAGGNTGSKGNFLHVDAENVTIRGIRIIRMSPSMAFFQIGTGHAADGLRIEDVSIEDCSTAAIKLFGGSIGTTFSSDDFVKNVILRRVSIIGNGYMGVSGLYTDDLRVSNCRFERINQWGEINSSPQSGAIKVGRTHRTVVEYSLFKDLGGHALWFDQSNYDCTVASNFFSNCIASQFFWEIGHRCLIVNNVFVRDSDSGATVRCNGSSGTWLVNNTFVGGSPTLQVIAEERGKYYTGTRPLAEHTERYGQGGSYNADSGVGYSSDLDKGRPGAYHATLPNATPGMNWMARAEAIVNNIFAHYNTSGTAGTDMALYLRALTSNTSVNVPAQELIPASAGLFDGNIYQVAGTRLAQVSVRAPATGGTTVLSNLSSWRGIGGLRNAGLYGSSAAPEVHGLEGPGWVGRNAEPTAQLDAVQGAAAPVNTTDTAMLARIKAYIDPDLRRFGSNLTPPGGWA